MPSSGVCPQKVEAPTRATAAAEGYQHQLEKQLLLSYFNTVSDTIDRSVNKTVKEIGRDRLVSELSILKLKRKDFTLAFRQILGC